MDCTCVSVRAMTIRGLYFLLMRLLYEFHLSKRPSDLKQNYTQKRHQFLAKFSIPFHMVYSILLRVLQKPPSDWLKFY